MGDGRAGQDLQKETCSSSSYVGEPTREQEVWFSVAASRDKGRDEQRRGFGCPVQHVQLPGQAEEQVVQARAVCGKT